MDNLVETEEQRIEDIRQIPDLADREQALTDEVLRLSSENDDLRVRLNTTLENLAELELLIKTNPDTNLPVYREFMKTVEDACDSKKPFWVAQIRLDGVYQRIKNSRDRSKALLFITTLRIKKVVGDLVFQSDRLDEFFVIAMAADSVAEIAKILSTVQKGIQVPHEGPAGDISFGAFMGFVRFPEHGDKQTELINNLDTALQHATHNRKRIVEYNESIGDAYERQLRLETDLHAAIQKGFEGFHLVYQPFVNSDNKICGCESLIRWNHPEFGMVPPPQFIPITERNGDIRIFGRWILYKSCSMLKEWHDQGHKELFVSVNLSPVQFNQRDLVENIQEILTATGIPGESLKLEITEGAVMTDPTDSVAKMNALKKLGIRLSIDDFGTGYSSLNYLRKLPIDTLKIDKSFIDDVTNNQQNQEIVRAILSMANSLHIETLAEGVETKEQRDFLVSEGCYYIQGYYFSKPVTEDIFGSYLQAGGKLAGQQPS